MNNKKKTMQFKSQKNDKKRFANQLKFKRFLPFFHKSF